MKTYAWKKVRIVFDGERNEAVFLYVGKKNLLRRRAESSEFRKDWSENGSGSGRIEIYPIGATTRAFIEANVGGERAKLEICSDGSINEIEGFKLEETT